MDFEMKLRGDFEHFLYAEGDREDLYKTFMSGINKTTNICVGHKSIKDIVNTSKFIALFYVQWKKLWEQMINTSKDQMLRDQCEMRNRTSSAAVKKKRD